MEGRSVSRYTVMLVVSALAVVVCVMTVVALGLGGERVIVAVADFGEILVVGLAASVLVVTGSQLRVGSSVGRPWLLIGLGAASYLIGDAVWTAIEVGQGREVPYPGVSDLFYLLEYPLVAAGILAAGLAFKGLVDVRRPALLAGGVGSALSVAVLAWVLEPRVLSDPAVPIAEKALSTLYPLADILLMLAPAVFVVGVVSVLGGGRLAWPWWAVAAGAVLIALADIGYSWLSAADLYRSGSLIDYGWSVGHAAMMLGGLIARDLARPVS